MNPSATEAAARDHQLFLDLALHLRLVARIGPGDRFVDLRLWRRSPQAALDDPRAWKPTGAGFRLPFDQIGTLRAILRDLQQVAAP